MKTEQNAGMHKSLISTTTGEVPSFKKALHLVPFAVILAACGPTSNSTPDYTFSIAKCGKSGNVEVPEGALVQVSVPGKSAVIRSNAESITIGDVTAKTGGEYLIGDPVGDHMEVNVLGDTDGNGSPTISVKSVCKVPMPATPSK